VTQQLVAHPELGSDLGVNWGRTSGSSARSAAHQMVPAKMCSMSERANDPIRFVQIFGERRSGTNYLETLVQQNFREVRLTRDFGGKHWFIRGLEPRGRANETTDHQCVRPLGDSDDTLMLVIHRNPYDWLRSLQAKPFHAWGHDSLPLREFITKPWVSSEVAAVNPTWTVRDDEYYFIEEATNVLAMRSLKLRHFLALPAAAPNVAVIRYDDLAADQTILGEIADRFNIALQGDSLRNVDTYVGRSGNAAFDGGQRYEPIGKADLDFINENLDWDIESTAGYSPADYSL